MIARTLLAALAFSLMIITPAAADGLYLNDDDLFLCLLGLLALLLLPLSLCLIIIEEEEKRKAGTYVGGQLIESYHQEVDRIRAVAAKIDADAQLAESYINGMRTRALIDELPEILQHDRATRRRR